MSTPNVCSEKPFASPKSRVRFVSLGHHSSVIERYPVAHTISDFILIIAPLWILRDVRVSPGLRTRLIAIFSCSAVTGLTGVAHAVLVLKHPGALEAIMGESFPPVLHKDVSPSVSPNIICGRYDNRGSVGFSPISHVTDAFHGLDSSLQLSNSDVRFFFTSFDAFVLVIQVPSRIASRSAFATSPSCSPR